MTFTSPGRLMPAVIRQGGREGQNGARRWKRAETSGKRRDWAIRQGRARFGRARSGERRVGGGQGAQPAALSARRYHNV